MRDAEIVGELRVVRERLRPETCRGRVALLQVENLADR
jgi:hypothetical protein